MSRFLITCALIALLASFGGCQQRDNDAADVTRAQDTPTQSSVEKGSADKLEELRTALASDKPSQRWDALSAVKTTTTIPVQKRAAVLLESMRQEIEQPDLSPAIVEGAYLAAHDFLMLWQTRTLGDLAQQDPGQISVLAQSTSGEEHERLILAMGYSGDRSYVQPLRQLVSGSSHWQVRSTAAFILGEMKAGEAAEELIDALHDTHMISREEHGQDMSFYPVRQQAPGCTEETGATQLRQVQVGMSFMHPGGR